MTREEREDAINYFKNKLKNEVYGAKYNKLAIEALEQEPFINKPCVSEKVCEHDKQMVLDKLRAEIDGIEINGQVDEHTSFIRTGEQVKQLALNIIDKYKAESEG